MDFDFTVREVGLGWRIEPGPGTHAALMETLEEAISYLLQCRVMQGSSDQQQGELWGRVRVVVNAGRTQERFYAVGFSVGESCVERLHDRA
ncbi:MAG: hypothetical protein ACPGVU_26485 [Limisphaerales bacterium]